MPLISVITATHDPRWLEDCYRSLKSQTFTDFEWCIITNGDALEYKAPWTDIPIRQARLPVQSDSIGAIKDFAFRQGRGKYLLELDHDDVLDPTALEKIAQVDADFIYSDCVDWSPEGVPVTYHDPAVGIAWHSNGWVFDDIDSAPIARPGELTVYPLSWSPSAASLMLVFYAPNHLRCWRREFYEQIGGHNPEREVCDDHELLVRTYLHGTMEHLREPLYWYRVTNENSWQKAGQDAIHQASNEIRDRYLRRLVEREMQLRELPCFDLGGGHSSPGHPWRSVDQSAADVICDLKGRWPFEDGSVGAFRAFDLLEHLPDKLHTMSEIHRCLAPGGWLLSMTPSALGAGAFQDPTHVSYWVEDSFRYYTTDRLNRFLPEDAREQRFLEARLETVQRGSLPYVRADLYKLDASVPGVRQ